jgi:hypothetical protein
MCAFIRMMVIGVNAEVNLTHFTAVSPK